MEQINDWIHMTKKNTVEPLYNSHLGDREDVVDRF